ncbi:hypothetical protein G6F59_015449 [Rhizopus arrhizus]|nr:hypothetical protein G6F59_015449 [Rhizopus arrhizus]
MRQTKGETRLLIAGTGPQLSVLKQLAGEDARIEFVGYVGDEHLADYYRNALCVAFVPQDEDLGLITLEAMSSGKPVITTRDSGGPTEFVEDGVTGGARQESHRRDGTGCAGSYRWGRKLAKRCICPARPSYVDSSQ